MGSALALELCLDAAVGEMQDVVACRVQEFLRIHLVKPFLGFFQVVFERVGVAPSSIGGHEGLELETFKAILHLVAQPLGQGLVI